MPTVHRYRIPRSVLIASQRTGRPVEEIVTVAAFMFGPSEYRNDIRQELGMSPYRLWSTRRDSPSRDGVSRKPRDGAGRPRRSGATRPGRDGAIRRGNRDDDARMRLALPDEVRWALSTMAQTRTGPYKDLHRRIADVLYRHTVTMDPTSMLMLADVGLIDKSSMKAGPRRYLVLVPSSLVTVSERTGIPAEIFIALVALIHGPTEYREGIRRSLRLSNLQCRRLLQSLVSHGGRRSDEIPIPVTLKLMPSVRKSLYSAGSVRDPWTKHNRLILYCCIAEFLDSAMSKLDKIVGTGPRQGSMPDTTRIGDQIANTSTISHWTP